MSTQHLNDQGQWVTPDGVFDNGRFLQGSPRWRPLHFPPGTVRVDPGTSVQRAQRFLLAMERRNQRAVEAQKSAILAACDAADAHGLPPTNVRGHVPIPSWELEGPVHADWDGDYYLRILIGRTSVGTQGKPSVVWRWRDLPRDPPLYDSRHAWMHPLVEAVQQMVYRQHETHQWMQWARRFHRDLVVSIAARAAEGECVVVVDDVVWTWRYAAMADGGWGHVVERRPETVVEWRDGAPEVR